MSNIPNELLLEVHRHHKYKCRYCGFDGNNPERFRYLTIDHIVPKCWGNAQGGTDDRDNLVTACRACNANKGTAKFDNVHHAKHWLSLYKKHCADAYYQAYVDPGKETGKWNAKKKLDAVWEKFIQEGGRGTRYKRNIKQISPTDAVLHPGV